MGKLKDKKFKEYVAKLMVDDGRLALLDERHGSLFSKNRRLESGCHHENGIATYCTQAGPPSP